jgi:hypothetical protein
MAVGDARGVEEGAVWFAGGAASCPRSGDAKQTARKIRAKQIVLFIRNKPFRIKVSEYTII